jgi:hypothetical protein
MAFGIAGIFGIGLGTAFLFGAALFFALAIMLPPFFYCKYIFLEMYYAI